MGMIGKSESAKMVGEEEVYWLDLTNEGTSGSPGSRASESQVVRWLPDRQTGSKSRPYYCVTNIN